MIKPPMKHTATPYFAVQYANYWAIQDGPFYEDNEILDAEQVGEEQAEANAQFIVKACNSYDSILDIIKRHTEKLDNMKSNRAKWEEEKWTDAECQECDRMIGLLASILSDLNRVLL